MDSIWLDFERLAISRLDKMKISWVSGPEILKDPANVDILIQSLTSPFAFKRLRAQLKSFNRFPTATLPTGCQRLRYQVT